MTNHKRDTRRKILKTGATIAFGSALPGAMISAAWAADRTLTIAIPNNPITIDPINQPSHDAMVLGQVVFENLVSVDHTGKVQPQLAVALPRISSDSLVYTFDLRDDVFFQNGQKMTAEDVKYSFDYMLDPKNKALRRNLLRQIKQVVVETPTRVRFELSEPYQQWLFFLTKYMGIFPRGSREQHGDDFFKSGPTGMGTGPGVFEEWRPNDFVSFKRSPNYWRKDLPKWDRLVVKIIPDDSARIAYLMSGQVDIISAPPPRDFQRLQKQRGLKAASVPTGGGWFSLMTNTSRAPFDDVHFRRAVACAIDRKTISEKVYLGLLDPCAVPAPPGSWWFNKAANDSLQFNLAKAREHLARSKYSKGAKFELTIPAEPYLLDVKDAAIVIQSQLAKINVAVELRVQESSTGRRAVLDGLRDAGLFVTMSPGEPTYLVQVNFVPGQNMQKASGYSEPEIAELLKRANAETDLSKLLPIYHRMQQKLAEDSPYVWIGFVHAANVWRDRVQEFRVNQGLTIRVNDVGVA